MAINFNNHYAEIDTDTGECLGVFSTNVTIDDPHIIEIPVRDDEYVGKYYINGEWYEDVEGTIPWQSSLI